MQCCRDEKEAVVSGGREIVGKKCMLPKLLLFNRLTFLLSLSSAKGFAITLMFSLFGAASSPLCSFFGVLTFFSFFSPISIVNTDTSIYVFEVSLEKLASRCGFKMEMQWKTSDCIIAS